MSHRNTLGGRLEAARKEMRLTRKELAQRVGTSPGVLRDLETLNSSPRDLSSLLVKLSGTLGKSLHFLLTGTHTPAVAPILKDCETIITAAQSIARKID